MTSKVSTALEPLISKAIQETQIPDSKKPQSNINKPISMKNIRKIVLKCFVTCNLDKLEGCRNFSLRHKVFGTSTVQCRVVENSLLRACLFSMSVKRKTKINTQSRRDYACCRIFKFHQHTSGSQPIPTRLRLASRSSARTTLSLFQIRIFKIN